MKLKMWLHGLGAAFIGGASSAVSVTIVDPEKFNIHNGWKNLLEVCLVNGVLMASAYLKQSPLPDEALPSVYKPIETTK